MLVEACPTCSMSASSGSTPEWLATTSAAPDDGHVLEPAHPDPEPASGTTAAYNGHQHAGVEFRIEAGLLVDLEVAPARRRTKSAASARRSAYSACPGPGWLPIASHVQPPSAGAARVTPSGRQQLAAAAGPGHPRRQLPPAGPVPCYFLFLR